MFAYRFGLDLSSPFDSDLKRVETTVSLSRSAQVSLMPFTTVNRIIIRQHFREAIS